MVTQTIVDVAAFCNSGDWQDWKDAHFDDLIEAGAGHEDDVSLPLLSSDGTSPPTEKK
jgi:hypothetical protein